jgi:hypothetical protein
LLAALEAAAGPQGQLRAAVDALSGQPPPSPLQIRLAFARAGRLTGNATVRLDGPLPIDASLAGWTADQLARLVILFASIEQLPTSEQVGLVETLYRTGSEHEQSVVARALAWLPNAASYAALAAEATRTNIVTVFAALACENPYPATHLEDLNFNQMVVKAIFMELDTSRISSLDTRVTPELVRMLTDYGAERRAAGRVVPRDIERITQTFSQRKSPLPGNNP